MLYTVKMLSAFAFSRRTGTFLRNSVAAPFINLVYVGEEFRGERLFQSLIDAALDYAQRLGYKKVYLKSEHHDLYEKYGFKKIADFEPTVGLANQLFEIKID